MFDELEVIYGVVAEEIVEQFNRIVVENKPKDPKELVDLTLKSIMENKIFTELCVTYLVTQVLMGSVQEVLEKNMAQTKTSQTMLNLESLFDDLMETIVEKEGFASKSSYLRHLVIEDLRTRGLVGEKELLQVLR